MYNRYLRNDQGVYTCVPQEEPRRPPPPHREPSPREPPRDTPPPPPNGGGPEADGGAFREGIPFLDSLLEKLHLQDLDGAVVYRMAALTVSYDGVDAEDFTLPDGTVLYEPVTAAQTTKQSEND